MLTATATALQTAPQRDYSDVLRMLLQDKRSENTRRAYRRDIENFFRAMTGRSCPEVIDEFLQLERPQAVAVVLQYKADLMEQNLAEATINRRLAAIKSLVNFARKVGRCSYDLADVQGEKVQSYRDVSGVAVEQVATMLDAPDRGTLKGKRDYAILRLLWENALRRGELVTCNIGDFDPEARKLSILGKGRGTQREIITLSEKAALSLIDYLEARGETDPERPLFVSVSNYQKGNRLTGSALYCLVAQVAQAAGIKKMMSPHRMRHTSITAALEATGGAVDRVQQLSRHKNVATVMLYNDRRKDSQGEVTGLLSAMA